MPVGQRPLQDSDPTISTPNNKAASGYHASLINVPHPTSRMGLLRVLNSNGPPIHEPHSLVQRELRPPSCPVTPMIRAFFATYLNS
jgi:hypothetical protein